MEWFNLYGLITVAVLMIPNIICVVSDKSAFDNTYHNKAVEITEQIGRFSCFGLMIFNVPFTYFGFWFDGALRAYLITNGILVLLYLSGWIVFRRKQCVLKALWLSVIPTLIFLFSGVVVASVPLVVAAFAFGIGHITISVKNAALKGRET
ncbi:MAG: hypothetical protein ACI4S9_03275 [Christensenellales bacterium]